MNPSSLKFRRTGKLILLFTIICTSQLYGMEPEKLTPTEATENPYKQLPKELQQEIVDAALASSTDLSDAIKAIKKLSVLYHVPINNSMLIHLTTKKFPTKIEDEIILAIEQPEVYQKLDAILKADKSLGTTIDNLERENLLQDTLKDFTILVHILASKFGYSVYKIARNFKIPIARKYIDLIEDLMGRIEDNDLFATIRIINNGADINYISFYDTSPLSIAIEKNYYDIVKLLLNKGANPNFKNPKNMTPSQYTKSVGASQEIQYLLEHAIRKNTPTAMVDYNKELIPDMKQAIINKALATNNTLAELVIMLEKLSALHNIPYETLNKDIFVNLLTKKFPNKIKDVIVFALEKPEAYQRLVTIFQTNKNLRMAEPIIEQENLLQDNLKDFTILIHILTDQSLLTGEEIAKQSYTPTAKKYRELGTSLQKEINKKSSPSVTITQIIEQGADVNFINKLSHTPLSYAIKNKKYNIIKLLLDKGANPNFKNPENMTPLQYMESVGASQEIKDLIEDAIKKW